MELTAEVAQEFLSYDPETGVLYWKPRERKWFSSDRIYHSWNTRYSNRKAFIYKSRRGYLHGAIFRKTYQAHRIAWLISYGRWPVDQIDHENGVRSDNRLCNLREASNKENSTNLGVRRDNKTGVTGVFWYKNKEKWVAQISLDKKIKNLGYYENFKDAFEVRKEAERKYGYHPNHGSDREQYRNH